MMAVYDYVGAGEGEIIYSVIIIFHLFMLNILLLNFMVAILSTTYGLMLESGSFMYKCALYEYCERYMIAFKNEAYGELVLHAPPINILVVLLLPFTPFKKVMPYVSLYFSYFNFWLENLVLIFLFIMFEIMLMPLVFIKTYYNIMYSTPGPFSTVFNLMRWTGFGIVYMAFMLIKDVYNLLRILSMVEGCKKEIKKHIKKSDSDEDEDKEMDLDK